MDAITLRIPKRQRDDEKHTLELFRWEDGYPARKSSVKAALPADILAKIPVSAMANSLLPGVVPTMPLEEYGKLLYSALHTGKIGQDWDELRKGKDLRLYLYMEDDAMRLIPWELLHDTLPFAQRTSTPVLRCRDLPLSTVPEPVFWPLRVMIIVGVDPPSKIGADDELMHLRRVFRVHDHAFDLQIVDARQIHVPDFNSLQNLVAEFRPEILHFIGHGMIDPNMDRSCLLIYDNRKSTSWKWWGRDITLALENAKVRPRLVYVNACRTGLSQPSVQSITDAFLQAGTLAVIGMQGDVGANAARSCAPEFYAQLAAGNTLDQALQKGRQALGSSDRPDIYLPMLTVAAPVELILPVQPKLDTRFQRELERCNCLLSVRESFVDRHSDRRGVIASFFRGDTDPSERYTAAYVRGPADVGKTWFAWWLLHACMRQHLRAHYVVPPDAVDWLEALRSVCEGNSADTVLSPKLPNALIAQFYWEVEQLAQGTPPPFGNVPDAHHRFTATLPEILSSYKPRNGFDADAMASFHTLLRKAAGSQPLVLVFDHFRGSQKSFSDEAFLALKRGLFDPIAEDVDGPIRLVLILPSNETDEFKNVQFSAAWKKIELGLFNITEVPSLVLEFFDRMFPDYDPSIVSNLKPKPGQGWTARRFYEFCTSLAQVVRGSI